MIALHFTCDPAFFGEVERETLPIPGDRFKIGYPPRLYIVESVLKIDSRTFEVILQSGVTS
jgi:hypothetical protein